MMTLLRVLAVVAMLFAAVPADTWGAPERPCLQETQDAGHHDEPCDDESPRCASCFCCHLRAAPAAGNALVALDTRPSERVTAPSQLVVPRPAVSGIFHPPRA